MANMLLKPLPQRLIKTAELAFNPFNGEHIVETSIPFNQPELDCSFQSIQWRTYC